MSFHNAIQISKYVYIDTDIDIRRYPIGKIRAGSARPRGSVWLSEINNWQRSDTVNGKCGLFIHVDFEVFPPQEVSYHFPFARNPLRSLAKSIRILKIYIHICIYIYISLLCTNASKKVGKASAPIFIRDKERPVIGIDITHFAVLIWIRRWILSRSYEKTSDVLPSIGWIHLTRIDRYAIARL